MSRKTIEQVCEYCGNAFLVCQSRMKHGRGRHCSPKCQYAARRGRPKRAVLLNCIGCGAKFSLPPSRLKLPSRGTGKYCSRQCRDLHWIGAKNPNWQNGQRVYKRGPRWHSIRRRILARDGACARCGATDGLHVHHIVPFRMFTDAEIANADTNLISLCPPCHRREDAAYKWVAFESGEILRFSARGPAWAMAREKGMI